MAALATALAVSTAAAEVRLAGIFGSNMVLQREMPVPVWGWAEPGEKITVEFKGQTKETIAASDGTWRVFLDPMKADDQPATLHVRAASPQSAIRNLQFVNVLVGEVWLCAGQSNMGVRMNQLPSEENDQAVATAAFPQIRSCFVAHVFDGSRPHPDNAGQWTVCSPETAGGFPAVPFYFARKLHADLGVPVGLLDAAYGGSLIEAWMSREALEQTAYGRQALAAWKRKVDAYQGPDEKSPLFHPDHPSAIFNGKIAPLASVAMRGALWYQGESELSHTYPHYGTLLPLLIADWRASWGRSDMPFLMMQLPNFAAKKSDVRWAHMREAVLETAAMVPHTGLAVTIDAGEATDIHPKNKRVPGERLALTALSVAYGKQGEYSGPLYQSMKIVDGAIEISFEHVAGGLKAQGDVLTGFVIAGDDRKFVPAQAVIQGRNVIVRADAVREPVAVRYGWANNPACNLYNTEKLPASPFRTDRW